MIFSVIGFMDLLGTIAFAISGALVGVKRDMDIFGINILAVITACGGGMTRDVVIGKEPPVMFVNPIYVLIAVITANIVFLYLYTNRRLPGSKKTSTHSSSGATPWGGRPLRWTACSRASISVWTGSFSAPSSER